MAEIESRNLTIGNLGSEKLKELIQPNDDDPGSIALLKEWFQFWFENDDMAGNTPDALHIRTVIYLIGHNQGDGDIKP